MKADGVWRSSVLPVPPFQLNRRSQQRGADGRRVEPSAACMIRQCPAPCLIARRYYLTELQTDNLYWIGFVGFCVPPTPTAGPYALPVCSSYKCCQIKSAIGTLRPLLVQFCPFIFAVLFSEPFFVLIFVLEVGKRLAPDWRRISASKEVWAHSYWSDVFSWSDCNVLARECSRVGSQMGSALSLKCVGRVASMGNSVSVLILTQVEKRFFVGFFNHILKTSSFISLFGFFLKGLSPEKVTSFTKRLRSEPRYLLAQNVSTCIDPLEVCLHRQTVQDTVHIFQHSIPTEGKPITNQKNSGT